jgi:hypothetical protein
MNGDVLLHWLSHLDEGPWSKFRSAVSEMAASSGDEDKKRLSLLNRLSELGHIDFFIENSRRWRVAAPTLVGLCGVEGTAVLSGARSSRIIGLLKESAEKHGCQFEVHSIPYLPSRVELKGTDEQLGAAARACRMIFKPRFAEMLCRKLPPITGVVGQFRDEPVNWHVHSFDLQSCSWVADKLLNAARMYKSSYGENRYFVCDQQNRLMSKPKREAVYVSASLQGVSIAVYDLKQQTLAMPATALLPVAYMRVACLSSGEPPNIQGRRIVFKKVAPTVGAALLVLAGQPHPGVPLL